MTIDSKLEFNRHINDKVNKANSIMAVIARTLQRSQQDYIAAIWSPYKQKYIDPIEKMCRDAQPNNYLVWETLSIQAD